jgi:hypothetical protein
MMGRPDGRLRPLLSLATLSILALAIPASPALAHAIAERYDLPVPLGFYIAGATTVVAVTFLITAVFVYAVPGATHGAGRGLRLPGSHVLRHPAAITLLQVSGVVALVAVIATGLFGNQHPARNLGPTLLWVMWWCGFSLFVACVANPWSALNPWRTLFVAYEAVSEPRIGRPYPKQWAEWPAVGMLLVFVWIELVSPFSSSPYILAALTLAYSAVTFAGMWTFGRETWLERGEVFTLVFRMLGTFSPIAPTREGEGKSRRPGLVLRGWSEPLRHEDEPPSMALVALVLLLLSSVLFDGLLGTALWRSIDPWLPQQAEGLIASTIGLMATWGFFLGAYLITCAAMRWFLGSAFSACLVARVYVLTLVPIAVGYNIAHNYSYLLIQGQAFLALLSDPFGFGWNLFGTAGWQPDLTVVDARTIWYVAVGAIVIGHIIAVYLAHIVALRISPTRQLAIRSLYPMTVLMVLYTGASLSILAEPIVRFSMPDPSYSLRFTPPTSAQQRNSPGRSDPKGALSRITGASPRTC